MRPRTQRTHAVSNEEFARKRREQTEKLKEAKVMITELVRPPRSAHRTSIARSALCAHGAVCGESERWGWR